MLEGCLGGDARKPGYLHEKKMNLKSYLTSQTKINPTSITELNFIEAKITQKKFWTRNRKKKNQNTFLTLVETKVFRKSIKHTIKKEEMNRLNFIEMKKKMCSSKTPLKN